uniref:Uncharacterized protein n=1 Tax=Cajanus cajan TaxID=3821 RepID=A0A151R9C1_CAJCA|nr:hypothetical protein KK1_039474 [Cajanus cajan]
MRIRICLYLSSITKKWPEQKVANNAVMDKKSELKPRSNLTGKLVLKSLISFLEVSIDRNITRAVTEKHSPINENSANAWNAGLPFNAGSPVSVLTPPGTVVDVAKETPARSAATTEQDSDVSLSHSLASFTSNLCESLKISPAIFSALLVLIVKCSGASPFMYCFMSESKGENMFMLLKTISD